MTKRKSQGGKRDGSPVKAGPAKQRTTPPARKWRYGVDLGDGFTEYRPRQDAANVANVYNVAVIKRPA